MYSEIQELLLLLLRIIINVILLHSLHVLVFFKYKKKHMHLTQFKLKNCRI